MAWYNIKDLPKEKQDKIVLSDMLEGYSTKQIMEAYHLTFVEVAAIKTAFVNDATEGIDFVALKVEELP